MYTLVDAPNVILHPPVTLQNGGMSACCSSSLLTNSSAAGWPTHPDSSNFQSLYHQQIYPREKFIAILSGTFIIFVDNPTPIWQPRSKTSFQLKSQL